MADEQPRTGRFATILEACDSLLEEAREDAEQGGWLSNLLTRASRDDAEAPKRAPAQSLNALDSISVDIARMIDHEAAIELWDRYGRGERNVFSRLPQSLQTSCCRSATKQAPEGPLRACGNSGTKRG